MFAIHGRERDARSPGDRHDEGGARTHGRLPSAIGAALVALAVATPARAQVERPISLETAVKTALAQGFELRIARAREEAARNGAREAASALYPNVSLESGLMRTSDPVAAFGTKLRQGRFGEADFATSVLNDPDPLSDWTLGVRIAWAGLDPARWAGAAAASAESDATAASTERARDGVRYETAVLYLSALRSDAGVRAAERAVEAAASTRDRFQRRFDEGLLTEADLLLARAELSAAEAGAIAASQARADARRRLGVALGWSADSIPVPSDALEPPEPPAGAAASGPGELEASASGVSARSARGLSGRADLVALRARVSAAEARASAATSGWLPKIEAFGAYTAHAAEPLSSDQPEWTVGIGLRWDVFTGFRRPASIARADAEAEALRAELARHERLAETDVARALEARIASARAWEASRLAFEAASAGRDLVRRRFEEGLAGSTDLLRAEARAADMERAAIDALARYHIAEAGLRFALGEAALDAASSAGGTAGDDGGPPRSGGER